MKCPFCRKEAAELVEVKLFVFTPKLCHACLEAWLLLLRGGKQTVRTLRRSK